MPKYELRLSRLKIFLISIFTWTTTAMFLGLAITILQSRNIGIKGVLIVIGLLILFVVILFVSITLLINWFNPKVLQLFDDKIVVYTMLRRKHLFSWDEIYNMYAGDIGMNTSQFSIYSKKLDKVKVSSNNKDGVFNIPMMLLYEDESKQAVAAYREIKISRPESQQHEERVEAYHSSVKSKNQKLSQKYPKINAIEKKISATEAKAPSEKSLTGYGPVKYGVTFSWAFIQVINIILSFVIASGFQDPNELYLYVGALLFTYVNLRELNYFFIYQGGYHSNAHGKQFGYTGNSLVLPYFVRNEDEYEKMRNGRSFYEKLMRIVYLETRTSLALLFVSVIYNLKDPVPMGIVVVSIIVLIFVWKYIFMMIFRLRILFVDNYRPYFETK